jgi:hypothetical protein
MPFLLRALTYHINATFPPVGVGLHESIVQCTIIELPHSVFGRAFPCLHEKRRQLGVQDYP